MFFQALHFASFWESFLTVFLTTIDVFFQCDFDVCPHRFFVVFEGVLQVFFEDMAKMEKWIWTGKN